MPAAAVCIFSLSGEYWTLGCGGVTFPLKDIKGLSYIQRLLQHPGEEFHSLDLLADPESMNLGESGHRRSVQIEGTDSVGGLGDSGPMLDTQAKQEYKRRLRELNEELEDQHERGAHDRAEQIESEIDFLNREIARAVGLGGRDRRAGSASERARLNVTRAIKAALQKISERHSSMGEMLDRSIKTGSFCSYNPDLQSQVTWQFSDGSPEASAEAAPAVQLISPRETGFLRNLTEGTTFVGRAAERSTLARCLEQALAGEGRIVLVGGAAGVGKTRIAAEIGAQALQRGVHALVGSCYDRDDAVPFSPFVEILESSFAQASNPAAFRHLLGDNAAEIARLMPQLRTIFPDIAPPLKVSPEQSRRMLLNAFVHFLVRLAQNKAALLLLDDLHWGDEGTLSLLSHIARSVSSIPILIVGTYRDNELDSSGTLAKTLYECTRLHVLERMILRGLPEDAVGQMIRALSGQEPPPAVVRLFYSGTEGNPFFVEELFRHLVEQGKLFGPAGEFRHDLKPDEVDVPQSLRLVIGRRLARLSDEAQKILATAGIIGRSFTFGLLEGSTGVEADQLLDRVEEAESAGLINSSLEYPEARFDFSHELIRQVVVSGLSAVRRQRLHLEVADAIERLYEAAIEKHADDLAHHLWHAGKIADTQRTVRFLAMAAHQAIDRSANQDAIAPLRKALDLLHSSPQSEVRSQQELSLQFSLAMALAHTQGHSSHEVKDAFARVRELSHQIGDSTHLAPAMVGLCSHHLVRAEYRAAAELAEETLILARRISDRASEMEAHLRLAVADLYRGNPLDARSHLERCLALQESEHGTRGAALYGQDSAVASKVYMGLALWELGYPDQALKISQEGLAKARELDHPPSLAFALCYSAWLRMDRGEWREFGALTDEQNALSNAQGLVLWGAIGSLYGSVILANQGQLEEALVALNEGLVAYRALGAAPGLPRYLAFQSTIQSMLGRGEEALALIGEAKEVARAREEFNCESELYRLEGQLLLNLSRADSVSDSEKAAARAGAEKCFLNALETSQQRASRSQELRVALSLARLWQRQGKLDQARRTLSEIYNWFSEGLETADLRRAKSLLAEMS